jgi:hypothetical protein
MSRIRNFSVTGKYRLVLVMTLFCVDTTKVIEGSLKVRAKNENPFKEISRRDKTPTLQIPVIYFDSLD